MYELIHTGEVKRLRSSHKMKLAFDRWGIVKKTWKHMREISIRTEGEE